MSTASAIAGAIASAAFITAGILLAARFAYDWAADRRRKKAVERFMRDLSQRNARDLAMLESRTPVDREDEDTIRFSRRDERFPAKLSSGWSEPGIEAAKPPAPAWQVTERAKENDFVIEAPGRPLVFVRPRAALGATAWRESRELAEQLRDALQGEGL